MEWWIRKSRVRKRGRGDKKRTRKKRKKRKKEEWGKRRAGQLGAERPRR